MVTIYDIAKKANVSAMTVSRVLNNSPNIKEDTRIRIEKIIAELDYIPNRSARSLISKHSKLLSLIITDITNPFFTKIARGAEDQADKMGYQVVFSNSDEKSDKESAYIRSAISRNIDGVLLSPAGNDSASNIDFLEKHRIPYVLIDREIEGVKADIVLGDNQGSIRLAMDLLFQNGHEKIALLTGPSNISNISEREAAYIKALQKKNISLDERWIQRSHLRDIQTDSIIDFFLALPEESQPTAIVATNNFLAVNALNSLHKRQIQLPQHMSIVSFDEASPLPDHHSFLTVVAQPAYEIGQIGMQLLIERIEGTETATPRKIVLPSELIVRQSVFKLV